MRFGHPALAACQFRASGFMNGWLTVNVLVVSRRGLGTSAAMSPLQREAAGERGFVPFRHFRAPLMRTKSRPPTPLKEQGNRSLRCGTVLAAYAAEVTSPISSVSHYRGGSTSPSTTV